MQIPVCGGITGYDRSNSRQHVAEIELKHLAQNWDYRLRKFENHDRASRLQYSANLAKSGISILQITQAERDGDCIERCVGKRPFQGICFDHPDPPVSFLGRTYKHRMAKVCCDDVRFHRSIQRDCQISRSTARIQTESGRLAQQVPDFSSRKPTPPAIYGTGKEMVEEVVSRGDSREHLLDAAAIRPQVVSSRH